MTSAITVPDVEKGNTTQSVWAGWGLRVTLSRDLAHKFVSTSHDKACEGNHFPVNPVDHWRLLGYHDFCQVSRFEDIEEIEKSSAPEQAVPWRVFRDLILLPLSEAMPSRAFVDALTRLPSEDPPENPFLVLTLVTFSPTVHEQGRVRANLSQLVASVRSIIDTSEFGQGVDLPDTHYFGSLGGADLVIVALPKDVKQLEAIHFLIQRLRMLSLSEVRAFLDGENDLVWDGHACAVVSPLIGFQEGSRRLFKNFEPQEIDAGLRIYFRLRVDVGHELQVVDELVRKWHAHDVRVVDETGEGGVMRLNCDDHAITGYFVSFRDFADAWSMAWFDPHWRRAHLLDSISTLSLKSCPQVEMGNTYRHVDRPWVLDKVLEDELGRIRGALDGFARQFLSQTQQTELTAVFNRFHSCFYRPDWVGIARDFYPFFNQLASCLRLTDAWDDYFKVMDAAGKTEEEEARIVSLARDLNFQSERFNSEMSRLMSHASRAIQNRIEHRSLQGAPPSPHTLRSGACKLLSAYTAMINLCGDLFREPYRLTTPVSAEGGSKQPKEPTVSVCLGAGTEGRVVCNELFEDFRGFAERAGVFPGLTPGSWRSRLLLFDISGKTLLRPEICFVHCLHEYVELSGWILSDVYSELREILNRWSLAEATYCFTEELVFTAEGKNGPTDETLAQQQARVGPIINALVESASKFVNYCLISRLLGAQTARATREDLRRELTRYLKSTNPFQFISEVVQHLCRWTEDIKEWSDFVSFHRRFYGSDPVSEPALDFRREVVKGTEFADAAENAELFITEVTADVGMWLLLDHLLGEEGQPRQARERLDDVCKIYNSLLTAAAEARGPARERRRIERTIIHRWAIQAASVAGKTPWQERILEELAAHQVATSTSVQEARDFLDSLNEGAKPQFGEEYSLVSDLRRLIPYGGEKPAPPLTPIRLLGEVEKRAIESFGIAWGTKSGSEQLGSRRIALIMNLWALSQQSGISQILSAASTKA